MLDPLSTVIGAVLGAVALRLVGSLAVRWPHLSAETAARLTPDQAIARLTDALRRTRLEIAQRDASLHEFRDAYEQRARELQRMRDDVRDAVKQTRELRAELIERVHHRIVREHSPTIAE